MSTASDTVAKAQSYYDSDDADNFYYQVWGGEDIHVGLYEHPEESIFDASRRTVKRMASALSGYPAGSHILDLGAGYGGSARYLAREGAYHVTCLNLSSVQNKRNRRMNWEQGLLDHIDVVDGNFEELPFTEQSFDVAWTQDALLHSANRQRVFEEVDRVLKPGGTFILTDPMMREGAPQDVLKPVFERIHLDSMGTVETYNGYAEQLGWKPAEIEERTSDLVAHYSSVLRELESRQDELLEHCSPDYMERMKKGLRHWIKAGENEALFWGIIQFHKPA